MNFAGKDIERTLFALGFSDSGISVVGVKHMLNEKPKVQVLEFRPCSPDERLTVLKSLAKQYKLKKIPVSICLSSDHYRVLVTQAPQVPDEELVTALQWDIKDLIDEPMDNITLDVFGIPGQEGARRQVNVVAANKVVISMTAELMKQAGINLQYIDIEDLSLRNIASYMEENQRGVMLVLLQKNDGLVVFVKDGLLYISRRVEVGTEMLASQPESRETLALELQRSADYFDRHFVSVGGAKHIMLFPTGKDLSELVAYLNENLAIPVVIAQLDQGLDFEKSIPTEMQAQCLYALGAALRSDDKEDIA